MNKSIYNKGLVVVLIIALIIIASLCVKTAGKEKDISFKEGPADVAGEENNENSTVIVDIEGAVKKPGVYVFKAGARVNDAIEASGGLSEKAYTKNINKARLLQDGEKIYIPEEGEDTLDVEISDDSVYNNSVSESSNKININTASKELLMSLNGIGEVYAKRIIEYRDNMKFASIEDIKKVKGIGDKTFDKIKALITVK